MPIQSPRDFEEWMLSVERRLRTNAQAGRAAIVTKIDEAAGSGGEGDIRVPAAPTVVTYSTALYEDGNGRTRARVTVQFNAVEFATNGTRISVDRYELWGRAWNGVGAEPPWRLLASSGVNAFVVEPFNAGEVWRFRVRAIGRTTTTPGNFSPEATVSLVADTTPPPQPSRPIVTVERGVFQVEWDGLDVTGSPMPPDFSYLDIAYGESSSPSVPSGRRLTGPGVEVFVGVPYGQVRYFRFAAVDASGNVSPWSGNASGVATPLVTIDGITLDEILAQQMVNAEEAARNAQELRALAIALEADAELAALVRDQRQALADTAHDAYLTQRADGEAALLAETGKTAVVWDAVPPAGSITTLWVDTSTSLPMVWDGAGWVEVIDPEVTATLALVFAALSTWNEAQAVADAAATEAQEALAASVDADQDADTAEGEAQEALEAATAVYSSSTGRNKITYSISDPSAGYVGVIGDTWFKRNESGTVIGYWEWTGAAWAVRSIGSQTIANLDVGKLTAGAGQIDTLAAQQLAAETAEFLQARAEWFAANQIEADWIGAGAIRAVHIGLGEVPPEALAFGLVELAPNPMWQDTAMRILFPAATGMSYAITAGLLQRGQTHVLSISPGAARRMPLSLPIPVSPGEKFYLRHESQRTSGSDWLVSLAIEVFDINGASLGVLGVPGSASDPANIYAPYEDVLTVPDAGATARLVVDAATGTTGTWTMSATSWRRAMASVGPAGRRLEISPAAIRLWGLDDEGQASVDISTNGAAVITLRDPATDLPLIVLDNGGTITAKHISADTLSLAGEGISGLFGDRPYGTLAKVKLATNQTALTTTARAITSSDFYLPGSGDRQIRLTIGAEALGDSEYPMAYDIKFNTTGTAGTFNSTHTTIDGKAYPTADWQTYVYEFNSGELGVDPLGTRFLSVLVCARTSAAGQTSGSVSLIGGAGQDGTYLLVEDMGPGVPTDRQVTTGSGSAQGLATKTSAETNRKWDQTYKGDGTQYTTYPARNYQGYYLAHNGVMKTAIGAPDQMFTDLAGATVHWIKVRLKAIHWYSAAGGVAVIGVHGNATKPSTFPGINQSFAVNFTRGQELWVTLPSSWYASFKSTAFRGITLTAGGSTSSTYYGYFEAARTAWRWQFTK